jgi:hypothetical protein
MQRKEARQNAKGFRKSKNETLGFTKLSAEKGSSDNCHVIEKAKSKRTEEMELYFFCYKEQNQFATILLI